MSFRTQILLFASVFHKATILTFGYFIPALSSVKAVVRRDSEAYHQWSCYWLILHLYLYILSPLLHITLHPIFQILAILWLSLPQYQGALVVYERLVNPWVDQYESKVDDAVEEAHRGVKRWIWSRFGGFMWLLIGEGGSLAAGLINIVIASLGIGDSTLAANTTRKPANTTERLRPRHSVKESLNRFPSFEVGGDDKFDLTEVVDFVAMLRQGLYVFASNITHNDDDETSGKRHGFKGGFKLGIFSYTEDAFLISPVAAGSHELDVGDSSPVKLYIDSLLPPRPSGSQGLILECSSVTSGECGIIVRAEIVLSDEVDRDILMNGLRACWSHIRRAKLVGR